MPKIRLDILSNVQGNALVALGGIEAKLEGAHKAAKKFEKTAQLARNVGVAFTALGAVITGVMGVSTKEAASFEDVMKDVEIQSGATAEQMEAIKEVALSDEFVKYGKSGTQVGEMFKRLAAEGYEVVQMQKMLKPITETAIALGTDEADTTKLMLNLMEQFNMEADDMGHISDVLASALANTSFQGQELADTMRMAGVAGSALGWSLEQTIGVTDRIIKVTGEASMAGRYFRSMMMSMRSPTDAMAAMFEGVGISLGEVAEAIKDPTDLMNLLAKAHEKGANFAQGFSNVAAVAAEALADEAASVEKVTASLGKKGAAEDAATEKMKTAIMQAKTAKAAMANLGQAIGQVLLPVIKSLGPVLVSVLSYFTKFARSPIGGVVVKIAAGFGVLMLALGPVLIAVSQMIPLFAALSTAGGVSGVLGMLGGLGAKLAALGAASGPILLVVAALSAAGWFLKEFIARSDEATAAMDDQADAAIDLAAALGMDAPEAAKYKKEQEELGKTTWGRVKRWSGNLATTIERGVGFRDPIGDETREMAGEAVSPQRMREARAALRRRNAQGAGAESGGSIAANFKKAQAEINEAMGVATEGQKFDPTAIITGAQNQANEAHAQLAAINDALMKTPGGGERAGMLSKLREGVLGRLESLYLTKQAAGAGVAEMLPTGATAAVSAAGTPLPVAPTAAAPSAPTLIELVIGLEQGLVAKSMDTHGGRQVIARVIRSQGARFSAATVG